ncbi:cytochrome c [Caulobacter sp. 17J80-11]|uniref:c-type cytochrome n=1 Tax=Caulobacter sp. 17J80-11 TaxID=2763502 RepID=UPI001CA4416E
MTAAARGAAALLATLGLAACGGQGRAARETHDDQLERGRYLVAIMDCGGCHTPGALLGAPKNELGLSGSDVGFETPAGVVYPPNLTPHPSGLGDWSEAQIIAAVRTGVRPDGRQLVFMPWPAYASLTDEDAAAMAAYLKSLPPIDHKVPGPSAAGAAPSPYYSLVDPSKRAR